MKTIKIRYFDLVVECEIVRETDQHYTVLPRFNNVTRVRVWSVRKDSAQIVREG